MRILASTFIALLLLASAGTRMVMAAPQSADTGRLTVVISDPSGAVLPGARVTVTPENSGAATNAGDTQAAAGADGAARFETLRQGRYRIAAGFDGFETVEVRGVRVGSGETRRTLTLPIRRVTEGLTVGRDNQDLALDPGGSAFSTILTREQIDALPDDPTEMEAVLKAMAPPGATIQVDGFTGGRLPPKSQIRSIRLPRMDQYAAQNHGGLNGALFIQIGTQPGGGALGGAVETSFRDDALNARNPFNPVKGAENLRQGTVSIGGPVIAGRSSFNIDFGGGRQLDSGTRLAALPDGPEASATRQTTTHSSGGVRFDQALGVNHTLRASFRTLGSARSNLGVGAYDLPDRAYSTSMRESVLRLSESGPIGRRLFIESRVEAAWVRTLSRSNVEAPAIRVLDAFTTGGAQQAGGRETFRMEAAADVDYVSGQHSLRTGVLLEAGRFQSDERSNYLGTYTFSSLADYEAGRPSLYTRRLGEASVRYSNLQFGAYVQDDYRVARSLLLSYGLRYEGQSLAGDWWNLTPRATITWAPSRSGRTTVRAAWGTFSDWLDTSVHEQAQRLDGIRQREIVVADPGYPEMGTDRALTPPNRYVLGDGFTLPDTRSWNVGIDQTLAGPLRVSATYTRRSSSNLLRGVNENAPRGGVRPNPSFRDVIRAAGDAGQRARLLNLNATLTWPQWRRTFIGLNYTLASGESNTTGAFILPSTGDLAGEWGATMPTHRFGVNLNMRVRPNLSLGLNARAQSGTPYNITTGMDSNDDGQFSDRPEGTPRNSARTRATWDVGGRLSYAVGFGGPARSGSRGSDQVVIRLGGSGGLEGGFDGGAENSRYRLEFYVSAQNLTNHPNYTGYSGVLTSPFFGQPTNLLNPRKVEIGVRVGW